VCLRASIEPVALGLALIYGIQLTALFQRVVQVTIDVTAYMISAERVFEYCEIEPEPSVIHNNDDINHSNDKNENMNINYHNDDNNNISDNNLKINNIHDYDTTDYQNDSKHISNKNNDPWPSKGIIHFKDVWMQYRDNPAVLRGISFATSPSMRIGTFLEFCLLFMFYYTYTYVYVYICMCLNVSIRM
jgi:ABC-type multidrug transport system fused ATPase/permease subunit